jgi:O-antigen ligase
VRPLSGDQPELHASRLNELLSFMLGFALVFSSPVGEGFFANWQVPLVGSYSLTMFDALILPVGMITLCLYGFRIKPQERFLYGSLSLVILSRIVSLVAGSHVEVQQSVSIFRYVEGMVVIYVCSIFFLAPTNRLRFVAGLFCGVALETIGGIAMFAVSGGQVRGIFISVNSFMLQVFVIVLGILAIRARRQVLLVAVAILIVFVGVLATLTRSALLLLAVCVILLFLADRRGFVRPILIFGATLIVAGAAFRSGALVPELTAAVASRNEDALARQGSVLHRLYLWDIALGTFVDHPLFGIGSGGFARLEAGAPQFFNVELSTEYLGEDYHLSTHNNLLGVASETGLFGLVAALLFAIAVFKLCLSTNLKVAMHASPLIASAAILTMALFLSDIWAAGSFIPISNTFIGFLAGWSRQKALFSA